MTPSTLTYSVATRRISLPPADLLYRQPDDRFGMARAGGDRGVSAGLMARRARPAARAPNRGRTPGGGLVASWLPPFSLRRIPPTQPFPCGAQASGPLTRP